MEILFFIIGVFLIILGIVVFFGETEPAGLFFIMGGVGLMFLFIITTSPIQYDVVCGENTYQEVTLNFEGDYLKITENSGRKVYEDGPCNWTVLE